MPNKSLCSDPDQCALCETCRRNPSAWEGQITERQPRTRPDVRGDHCGSWEEMLVKERAA